MTTVETPRLVLRRWREADVTPMAAINADPEVIRWIGDGQPRSRQSTEAAIAACERRWDELGYGWFAVESRSTSELAGFTGLDIPDDIPDVMPAVEIGWRLGRRWGEGIATEAARAALRFAFPRPRDDPGRRHSPDRQPRLGTRDAQARNALRQGVSRTTLRPPGPDPHHHPDRVRPPQR